MGIEFNAQQKDAIKDIGHWYKSLSSHQVYELSGRPGTGKTTLMNYVIKEELGLDDDEFIIVSFTGKATQQLIRKGNKAHTIHSIFYKMCNVVDMDENGQPIMEHGRVKMKKKFLPISKDELDPRIKLIAIDEAPMTGANIAKHILSFGKKVLALGDIDQLPPVMDKPFFMIEPNRHLTQIMRQAEGNMIIKLATDLIEGRKISYGKYGDNVMVIPYELADDKLMKKSDIILAAKNSTRDIINNRIRYEINQRKNALPHIGDKIICRKTNYKESISEPYGEIYLINGLSGTIEGVRKDTYTGEVMSIDFKPDFTMNTFYDLRMNTTFFASDVSTRKEMKSNMFTKGELFEMGDACTVHLSQGSEWDFVTYFKESIGFNQRYNNQLNYTAVTRAKDKLVIVQ